MSAGVGGFDGPRPQLIEPGEFAAGRPKPLRQVVWRRRSTEGVEDHAHQNPASRGLNQRIRKLIAGLSLSVVVRFELDRPPCAANRFEHGRIELVAVLEDFVGIPGGDRRVDEARDVLRKVGIARGQGAAHPQRARVLGNKEQHADDGKADDHHNGPLASLEREPSSLLPLRCLL